MTTSRSIGSISLQFGIVNVPVKMYSVSSTTDAIAFHTLHSACNTKVKQRLHCETCDVEVPREETTKGYPVGDEHIVLSPEEIDPTLGEPGEKIGEITAMVPFKTIGVSLIEKAYYLAPDKAGKKIFNVFRSALAKRKVAAVGKCLVRKKEHPFAVIHTDEGLILYQLRFGWAVRTAPDVPITKPAKDELDAACDLIDRLAQPAYDPAQFVDDERERLSALIDAKIAGAPMTATAKPATDLMAQLKESIRKGPKKAPRKRKTKKKVTT